MGTKITRVGALVVLLTLLGASGALAANITADPDSVYVDTTFVRQNFSTCAEFGGNFCWNPSAAQGDTCTAFDSTITDDVQGYSFCHFKILSDDGSCMFWNSLLGGASGTGSKDIDFAIPVGATLTKDSMVWVGASDYDNMTTGGYWQSSGFSIERGETYTFQITEQLDGCKVPVPNDPAQEAVRREVVLTIPCACVGIRGNVDCDPEENINLADITRLIAYLNGGDPPLCWEEGDVDADTDIDTIDRNYLIQSVYYGGPDPEDCP